LGFYQYFDYFFCAKISKKFKRLLLKNTTIQPLNKPFNITINSIATDKSISHRCAMFATLSNKPSKVKNFLKAEDTLNSLSIVQKVGAKVEENTNGVITITPPKQITEVNDVLDCGNSGTGMRLFCGLFAGMNGLFVLHGDKYLAKRPMKRVVNPLRDIGAKIDGIENGNFSPLCIRGGKLKHFNYESKIASAQVKSALILAALNGDGTSVYTGPELTRDHSENMLKGMGANLETKVENGKEIVKISPLTKPLEPLDITVPSDPSSGFFFAVAAAITPNAKVTLKNMLLNKTRIEAYKVLQKMGVKVTFNQTSSKYESIGDIIIEHNELNGVEVSDNISWLIDEIPALSIAFALANGKSIVKNAEELRVKESDRIKSTVENLKKCGVNVTELEDGFEVTGGTINKATINSFGDHRIAMSFAIAGLKCGMNVEDIECIDTSFPNFFEILDTTSR
jgi:3-phosphoshikimate 1-carboxyvinyltransferase